MTTAQATDYTAFIANRAIRAQVTAALLTGRLTVCPDCNELANPETGCTSCDQARFAALEAQYEAKMANAECGEYGMDTYSRY